MNYSFWEFHKKILFKLVGIISFHIQKIKLLTALKYLWLWKYITFMTSWNLSWFNIIDLLVHYTKKLFRNCMKNHDLRLHTTMILLMGCFPFSNYHFQMGVTVMGFAEHFGYWQSCVIRMTAYLFNLVHKKMKAWV